MVLESGHSHSFYSDHAEILMDNLQPAEHGGQTSATGKREHEVNELKVLQRKHLFHPKAARCSVAAVRNCLEA